MTTAQKLTWEELQPPDPVWWGGADGREVNQFEIYPATAGFSSGDGGGLKLRATEDLKNDAALAGVLLKDSTTRTDWMVKYARLLAHELRRRGKAGAA